MIYNNQIYQSRNYCKQIHGLINPNCSRNLKNLSLFFNSTSPTPGSFWIYRIDINGKEVKWGSYGMEEDEMGWIVEELNNRFIATHY